MALKTIGSVSGAESLDQRGAALRKVRGWNWGLPARIVAAAPLNYVLTSLAVAALARLIPASPLEASTAATLVSFLVFAITAMLAFSVRSVLKLWLGMLGTGLVLGVVLWMSISVGGRL